MYKVDLKCSFALGYKASHGYIPTVHMKKLTLLDNVIWNPNRYLTHISFATGKRKEKQNKTIQNNGYSSVPTKVEPTFNGFHVGLVLR